MRIALIYRVNYAEPQTIGVQNKQTDQQAAFIEMGYDCDSYYHRNGSLIKRSSRGTETVLVEINYRKHSFDLRDFFKALSIQIARETYDYFYIRYPIATASFIRFLKTQNTPTTIEIPTYPYLSEWKGMQKLFTPFVKFYESKLKEVCKHIVHFGDESTLFGIETIRIANGINAQKYRVVDASKRNVFTMIAVGNFNYWHGLDRIIRGIVSANNMEVKLLIVGDGEVIPKLKKLVSDKNLDEQVFFFPVTYGDELDLLFDKASLGVGTLGIHRKSVKINASLKHREYTLRGLPFIYAGEDWDFEKCDFALRVPSDDTAIDIVKTTKWSSELSIPPTAMRNYAESYLSWKHKLTQVTDRWEED